MAATHCPAILIGAPASGQGKTTLPSRRCTSWPWTDSVLRGHIHCSIRSTPLLAYQRAARPGVKPHADGEVIQ